MKQIRRFVVNHGRGISVPPTHPQTSNALILPKGLALPGMPAGDLVGQAVQFRGSMHRSGEQVRCTIRVRPRRPGREPCRRRQLGRKGAAKDAATRHSQGPGKSAKRHGNCYSDEPLAVSATDGLQACNHCRCWTGRTHRRVRAAQADDIPLVVEQTDASAESPRRTLQGTRIDIGGHRFFSKSERVMNWWFNILPLQGAPSADTTENGHEIDYATEAVVDFLCRQCVNVPALPGETHIRRRAPDPEREDEVMLQRPRLSRIYYRRNFFPYPIAITPRSQLASAGEHAANWAELQPRPVDSAKGRDVPRCVLRQPIRSAALRDLLS